MSNVFRKIPALLLLMTLAACGGAQDRYLLPDVAPGQTYRSNVRSVEVTSVDLPLHAEDTEISVLGEDGVLRATKSGFWADEPDRALTEQLALGLDQALPSASVATEPWPLETPADVQVNVKVRNLVSSPGKSLTLNGQYNLTSPSGNYSHRERLRRFSLTVPIPDESLDAVAKAHSEIIRDLADHIARTIAGQ
ncbi:membrane integrity-associated transporter subunit PqiC [Ruegeria sp. Ofav3-42]|uniref:PqiC family protein n=1 Tax=Ruegeria sp. Ofav3-42 TaxID=2917759 RepID=UPI001EF68A87|nr:PqiC family protein [Ruegeria sp. Ofav3-42]MCG7518325.1 PqiC family protein [Ruegeria sp. Ofav3-42]